MLTWPQAAHLSCQPYLSLPCSQEQMHDSLRQFCWQPLHRTHTQFIGALQTGRATGLFVQERPGAWRLMVHPVASHGTRHQCLKATGPLWSPCKTSSPELLWVSVRTGVDYVHFCFLIRLLDHGMSTVCVVAIPFILSLRLWSTSLKLLCKHWVWMHSYVLMHVRVARWTTHSAKCRHRTLTF